MSARLPWIGVPVLTAGDRARLLPSSSSRLAVRRSASFLFVVCRGQRFDGMRPFLVVGRALAGAEERVAVPAADDLIQFVRIFRERFLACGASDHDRHLSDRRTALAHVCLSEHTVRPRP